MNTDFEMLFSNGMQADYCLNSVYEIEDLLVIIRQLEDKMRFYADLKKFRTKAIDEEVSKLEQKTENLRRVVLNTMTRLEPKKRSLDFPSVGKVVRRAGKVNWRVENEQSLLGFLEKQGVKSQVVVVKEQIDKKALNKVLDCMDEQQIQPTGVKKIDAGEVLGITFADDEQEEVLKVTKKKVAVEAISESDL